LCVSALFPYTTRFRSAIFVMQDQGVGGDERAAGGPKSVIRRFGDDAPCNGQFRVGEDRRAAMSRLAEQTVGNGGLGPATHIDRKLEALDRAVLKRQLRKADG